MSLIDTRHLYTLWQGCQDPLSAFASCTVEAQLGKRGCQLLSGGISPILNLPIGSFHS